MYQHHTAARPNFQQMGEEMINPNSGFGFSTMFVPAVSDAPRISQDPEHDLQDCPELLQPFLRGRDSLFRDKYRDYSVYSETSDKSSVHKEMTNTIVAPTALSNLFYSEENIEHILNICCQLISVFSNGLYNISSKSQNKSELLTIMRSMYLQTPTNHYGDLKHELSKLNRATIDWAVPRLLTNIQQYLGYMRDASSGPVTIPRPQATSIVGTKTNCFFSGRAI